MYRKITVAAIVTMLTLIIIIIFATDSLRLDTSSTVAQGAFAQSQQKFTAKLTGKEEVPPTNTTATGIAQFVQSADGKALKYKVNVMHINAVTRIHLGLGKPGQKGPIIATIKSFESPTFPITNATLSEGNITSSELYGPLINKPISELVKMINDGDVYINMLTLENPTGEIRGQLSPSR